MNHCANGKPTEKNGTVCTLLTGEITCYCGYRDDAQTRCPKFKERAKTAVSP